MALPIDPQAMRDAAPEFAALSDPELQVYIDQADQEINPDAWGSRAELAELYLALHLATIERKRNGAPGPVTGIRVGDVATQYAAPVTSLIGTGVDPSLMTTSYGLAYARLIKISGYGFATT
jgi:hypothetical protein